MRDVRLRLILLASVVTLTVGCYREGAVPDTPVSSTVTTTDNAESLSIGTDAMGRVGDYVLQNSNLQIVINGDFNHQTRDFFVAKSAGAILDISTRFEAAGSRKTISADDDGLNQISQGVNLNRHTVVSYDSAFIEQDVETAGSMTLYGGVYDLDGSLAAGGAIVDAASHRVRNLAVETVYEVSELDLDEVTATLPPLFVTMTTVLTNNGDRDLPIWTLNDVVATTSRSANTFIPYPDCGYTGGTRENPAYPPYVWVQPKQLNTTHYAYVPLIDKVLSAARDQDTAGNQDYVMVGKATPSNRMLAAGEQLTFMRKLLILNQGNEIISGITSSAAYNGIFRTLKDDAAAGDLYETTGVFSVDPNTAASPGGEIVIGMTNQSVTYFNGVQFVPLEEGRTFPIFGDQPVASNYAVTLPLGEAYFETRALNSEPTFVDFITRLVTDEDGTVQSDENGDNLTEDVALSIREDLVLVYGGASVSADHTRITLITGTPGDRFLMGRATVYGADGSAPRLGDFPRSAEENQVYINLQGNTPVNIPVGDYDFYVTRGPLFNLTTRRINVPLASTVTGDEATNPLAHDFELVSAFNLPGWLSTDFDVRTDGDPLGFVSEADQLRNAYASDLDIIFTADAYHQSFPRSPFLALSIVLGGFDQQDSDDDVESLLDELAYARATAAITRDSNGQGLGRFGLLNLPDEREREFVVAPPFETDLPEFFDRCRAIDDGVLIHVTRPRAPEGLETGYFTAIAKEAGLATGQAIPGDHPLYQQTAANGSTTRRLDFDLLQLVTGNHYDEFLATRADWFNLLNAGVFKPVTGGSFPGETKDLPIGSVRTYTAVEDTTLRDNDLVAYWDSVRAGHMFISNGPILEVTINGASYGESTTGSGSVTARVRLRAADWIPVEQLRYVVDGVTHVANVTLATSESGAAVRYEGDLTIPLPEGGSHWIVFEAGAALDKLASGQGDDSDFGKVNPGHHPLAVTNPIFVQ